MAELSVRSVLVTGANRGLGLGLVQHFLRMPKPPQWIFAGCRDPKGQRAQVRLGWRQWLNWGIGGLSARGRLEQGGLLQVSGDSVRHLGHRAAGLRQHESSCAWDVWRELCYLVIESSPSIGFRAAGAQCEVHGRAGMEPEQCWLFLGKAESLHSPSSLSLPTQCPLFQELQNLASKHPNIIIIPLEVANPASIKAAAAQVGEHLGGSGLNILINNAGIVKLNALDAETLEDMSEVYTTNTIGPLLMGQAFLPLLKKAAQGSPGSGLSCSRAAMVNISSIVGSISSSFGWEKMHVTSYRCSKAALNMLSKCQSLAYKEHGILCVALHPGWVQTDMGSAGGETELQNLASKHPNIIIIPLEVANPASIKAAAAKVGEHLGGSGLNLLINNAGILKVNTLDAETLEDMREIFTTNTIGPLLMGQAFLPLLKKAAQGSPGSGLSCSRAAIINLSSQGGSISSLLTWEIAQAPSYRCSKAALNMLSKCQSLAYKEHGILCVALHPGWVQTDMGRSLGLPPPVTLDDSVQGMLKVLSSISEKETGAFLDWEGKVIPW
uniref:C-factor n=1 Tax=Ficedula albicollis TaxID=59894 RepID=U3JXC2_FICAL